MASSHGAPPVDAGAARAGEIAVRLIPIPDPIVVDASLFLIMGVVVPALLALCGFLLRRL